MTAHITDTPPRVVPGQLGGLELRHREHARVEDRIRQAKATGLANLPCHRFDANAAWLEIILAATDLVAWTKLIGFHGHTDLATCEIATFRYRVLHVAARTTRGARKVRLRIGRDLAVGHRDLPSMATTSGRAPLTTRPTRAYRPKATRPWKARPPSDTGRPVTPTCNNQHPNRVIANPPPPTTAARIIEARASCN